ncbi:unnamed protein product, partial [Didymodactylos carnosus]
GYIQRFENGADVVQTQEQIIKQIQGGALALTPKSLCELKAFITS